MTENMSELVTLAREVGGNAWPILVRGVWVRGLTELSGGVILAIYWLTIGRKLLRAVWAAWDSMEDAIIGVGGSVFLLVGSAVTLFYICYLPMSISAVLYPEGAALLMLLK